MSTPAGFSELHPVLQHHIVNTLGWRELRPLQQAAIAPVVAGEDALLLAPTAGGKTEAALFPLLTRMANESWAGPSVLYVCPLRALLNNLEPRIASYAGWLGRSVAVRHGDTGAGARRRIAIDRPDIVLTTPESLEAMLVSTTIDARILLSEVRTVVVDEVHAFAGDDRGWHLLAVLERIAELVGRPLQRIGLSATVGNAPELLTWLQGSGRGRRSAQVINPEVPGSTSADVELDYVGSVTNAAKIISALHRGQKRLVFAESRARVEELAQRLIDLGTETYVSHSSLSAAERRRAERAFAEARDCVIVATSTLELGIDVGDLDRVIQVGTPTSVAAFLQRLGRTGRRRGTSRNALFLTTSDDELLTAAALLLRWSQGYVESVVAPPGPRHLLAQQLLALCLQKGQVGRTTWVEPLRDLGLTSDVETMKITEWMIESEHVDVDSAMLFVGPEAERRYGYRHFIELLSLFTSAPEFLVVHGSHEVGSIDPYALIRKVNGPRVITLAGRGWLVQHIDWSRRRAYVEPSESLGTSRWIGIPQPLSYQLMQAERGVLLGSAPASVQMSDRAGSQLIRIREELAGRVDHRATVIESTTGRSRWWTWAGGRANASLMAALEAMDPALIDEGYVFDNRSIALRAGVDAGALRSVLVRARGQLGKSDSGIRPIVTQQALEQLKFSELLPPDLARATLEARLEDVPGAAATLSHPVVDSVI
ncbi:DEAD/DEAH box helicase [Microlunatus elymi]|uniref:DEAD/DEAH box helicase n=1 Tax=Microlunatus elymi TaxID=2596828 RepID=A0A516PTS0_9ACTN|nr:DEAD/DEAH box helicase [Microlunatus elymi]QDP94553.1 DEAD/DEAH box helicase [Microlunatus elymi]